MPAFLLAILLYRVYQPITMTRNLAGEKAHSMADDDKIIQLPLPLIWWREKDIVVWRDRHHVSSVQRPTEDLAFDNVYYSRRAVDGKFGRELNGLERKVYFYELRSYEIHPKWYTEADRVKWIASKTGMPITAVKDTLHSVKIILRELVRVDDILIEQSYKNAAKEILHELASEYETRKQFIAA